MDAIVRRLTRDKFCDDGTERWVARAPLLHWAIFGGASIFAAVLLWHYRLIQLMIVSDRTHISSLIALFYIAASLHCLWRTFCVSREAAAAQHVAALIISDDPIASLDILSKDDSNRTKGLVADHIRNVATKAKLQGAVRLDQTLLLRNLAGRLRASNHFGSFASDTLMKLGLLGTIVGFIMMLAPVAGLDANNRGALKSSMALMSDGMAVAMYTTLAGLVGSILIKIQYYMLDDATAGLFNRAVNLTEVYVISALDRQASAQG